MLATEILTWKARSETDSPRACSRACTAAEIAASSWLNFDRPWSPWFVMRQIMHGETQVCNNWSSDTRSQGLHCRGTETTVSRMTPSQRLLDRQLPGGLDKFVSDRRSKDRSWEDIAQDIREATSRSDAVATNTLRRWYTKSPVKSAA
jgi:hypothetical protein